MGMECIADGLGLEWVTGEVLGMPGTFFLGGIGGMLVVLLVVLFILLVRRRRRSRGIWIRGDNGSLYVTPNAIREFVARVMQEFNEAALHAVWLRQGRDRYTMHIAIQVSPDTEVIALVEDIRRRIIQQASRKIGLEKALRVNVTVRSFSPPEKKTLSTQTTNKRDILTGFPNLVGVQSADEGNL
jgi:hypothetical protein